MGEQVQPLVYLSRLFYSVVVLVAATPALCELLPHPPAQAPEMG